MSTRDTITRSLSAVWPRAVSLTAAMSQPRTDVEAADADFVALLQRSAIARAAGITAGVVRDAWTDSRVRSIAQRAAGEARALSREQAVRAAGWMVAVASTVALVLTAIKPTPAGPLAWALPASFAAVSLVALIAAGPLARACGDRRS